MNWKQYTEKTDTIDFLKNHRDWVEKNKWGFGDRALHYMWYELLLGLEPNSKLLEIGVHKGQTVSLWGVISKHLDKRFDIYALSPFNGAGDAYYKAEERNYIKDLEKICADFIIPTPFIIKGYSHKANTIKKAGSFAPYNLVFIDGSHDYEVVISDLNNYTPLCSQYLVVDDSAVDINKDEYCWFSGLGAVTHAVNAWKETQNDFEELNNVGYVRIFKRKATPLLF